MRAVIGNKESTLPGLTKILFLSGSITWLGIAKSKNVFKS